MNYGLKEKILELRKERLSYKEIARKLNCGKSTISYHCSQRPDHYIIQRAGKQLLEEKYVKTPKIYTKEQIQSWVNECFSLQETSIKFGMHRENLRKLVRKLGVSTSHFKYKRYRKYNKDTIEKAVKESISFAETLRKLGMNIIAGGNYKTLQAYIAEYDIDISHFKGQAWNKENYKSFAHIRSNNSIKKNLIRERGNVCEDCKISTWKDQSIKLELHHINGINNDNRKENLQLLCANCHSMTPNFRNNKR